MTRPTKHTAWGIVADMEDPIATVADLLKAMNLMAAHLNSDEDISALIRLLSFATLATKQVEEQRGQLFELLHPHNLASNPEARQ